MTEHQQWGELRAFVHEGDNNPYTLISHLSTLSPQQAVEALRYALEIWNKPVQWGLFELKLNHAFELMLGRALPHHSERDYVIYKSIDPELMEEDTEDASEHGPTELRHCVHFGRIELEDLEELERPLDDYHVFDEDLISWPNLIRLADAVEQEALEMCWGVHLREPTDGSLFDAMRAMVLAKDASSTDDLSSNSFSPHPDFIPILEQIKDPALADYLKGFCDSEGRAALYWLTEEDSPSEWDDALSSLLNLEFVVGVEDREGVGYALSVFRHNTKNENQS